MEKENAQQNKPQNEKETLYVSRDVSQTLGAAWTLLSTNFKRICRAIALPTLVFAMAAVLYVSVAIDFLAFSNTFNPDNIEEVETVVVKMAGTIGCTVLMVLATLYIYSATLRLLNQRSLGYNLWRMTKVSVAATVVFAAVYAVIIACVVAIAKSLGAIAVTIAVAVLSIAFFLMFVPFLYSFMKYLIEPGTRISILWKAYRAGLRQYWFILGTVLLSIVVVYAGMFVTQMPLTIVVGCKWMSDMGAACGDPSGLPSGFGALVTATVFISSIVSVVFSIFQMFVFYYIYGTIEVKNSPKAKPVNS